MKKFKVEVYQEKEIKGEKKGRSFYELFETFEEANNYASEICEDINTRKCSIYKIAENESNYCECEDDVMLIMDVL